MFVLGDYYKVEQAVPASPIACTPPTRAKYATTRRSTAGFAYPVQGRESGWWQPDFATTRFEWGWRCWPAAKPRTIRCRTFAPSTIAANFRPDQRHRLLRAAGRQRAEANGAMI
ncbi:MAG: hypothetical protein IPK19_41260 [Chloroflexi bacterium]|nr:hypothetical protein [Chloroflexota bacterium]